MSGLAIETPPWPNRRWFLTIVLLFVAQVALIFLLTRYPVTGPIEPTARTRNRILSGATYEAIRDPATLIDPTLFALVHPKGFSGAAWLKPIEFPYHPTNEIESPRWLSADPTNLGVEFGHLLQTYRTPAQLFTSKPLHLPPSDAPSPTPGLVLPRLRTEGDLATRRLLTTPKLPKADPAKILTNCVISVMIGADGDVLSAFFRTSSGSIETDREALKFAHAARFTPITRGDRADSSNPFEVVFGRFVLEWSLVPKREATAQPTP